MMKRFLTVEWPRNYWFLLMLAFVSAVFSGCGGGSGSSSSSTSSGLSSGREWTWVSGANSTYGASVYGTQGVAAADNIPGARGASATWVDQNGNLWLFGGFSDDSSGSLSTRNDLWEYTPSTSQWTWVGGSDTANANGVYGTQDVAAAANVPGARSGAITWVDQNGYLWLFGGHGYDSAGTLGDLNDLWRYDPATNQWSWIGGSSTANAGGVYGTQAVAATDNIPGARSNAAAWVDGNGNLWLFGGYRSHSYGTWDLLNDLWKFDPTTNQWTWMGGSDTPNSAGVYGTQGIAAVDNIPGARSYAATWVDADGNFWLFGGYGSDSEGSIGQLNDLWEYDPTTRQWVWVSGSSKMNAGGVYGTKGVAVATNVPGGRSNASAWEDESGDFWLFGGYGAASNDSWPQLNDLWRYNPATNQWTWMGGSNIANVGGDYGTQGVAAVTNAPGARSNAAAWVDQSGNFWLFGGSGVLNDLWEASSLNQVD